MTTDTSVRYMFGREATHETLGGYRLRQLPAVLLGLAGAALALRTIPADLDILAAIVLFVGGAAAATQPIAGHRIDEWVPLMIGWVRDRVVGRHRWRSATPTFGHRAGFVHLDPPPAFADVEVLCASSAAGDVGAMADHARGIYSAALRIGSTDLLLDSMATQEQRLAAWGAVLAAAARGRSPVHRLQWVERTVPDDRAALNAWFEERAVDGDAAASYRELLASTGASARSHESIVAVSVAAVRAGQVPRERAARTEHMLRLLARELALVSERLTASGFTVDGVMSPPALVEALRVGFDPFSPRPRGDGDLPIAWPLATDTGRRWYRSDDAWHATYWIEQWPRLPVRGDFLAPLVLEGPAVRTISILAEPVSAAVATRQVERDLVSAAVNDGIMQRAGFRVTARRQAQTETAARREEHLAAGHEEFNTVGLITVSAKTDDELAEACADLEQVAQQAHLGIRRLWGRQAEGFAAAQPLALGMK